MTPRLRPRSVRARVTALFTAGTAGVMCIAVLLLYVALDRALAAALDADLQTRAADLGAAIRAGDTSVVATDPMAQLYGNDGSVLVGSAALGGRRLLSENQARGIDNPTLATLELPSDGTAAPATLRVLATPVQPGQTLGVASSAEPLDEARQRLILVLLVAGPILIGVVAAIGWTAVRAALRPVDLLTREAAAISSLGEPRRLPTVPGDDEISRLARTLDDMLTRLRVSFERERGFVDDASHELRSPIAVLRGELELAVSALDDPVETERSLRAALAEAERLSRLAEDLLLLARERAGTLLLRTEPVDLLDLAATEGRRLGPGLGVSVSVTGPPVVAEGDPDRLRQVIANALHNSAEAGATAVEIRVVVDPGSATLVIADDGPGLPPSIRSSAFERFVRGDEARTHGRSGAGLGLSILRAIVAAHGGTVTAHTGAPLGGAVLTIRLPQPPIGGPPHEA